MAIYKCDIKQQLGKFVGFVWKAGEAQGSAVCKDESSAANAATQVTNSLKTAGFGRGDEVIFRDSAYSNLVEVQDVLSKSRY